MHVFDHAAFDVFFAALTKKGYQVVGPTLRDHAIVYDLLSSVDELPKGWGDEQDKGTYRVKKREDIAFFGFNAGPHTWKKFLFPPKEKLWEAHKNNGTFEIIPNDEPAAKQAFLGVRSCELHAIAIQDKVFMEGQYVDSAYKARRENTLIIAANCTQSASTCFCPSMQTGPKVSGGFDLALTEIITAGEAFFLVETGSTKGEEILEAVPVLAANEAQIALGRQIVEETERHITRSMPTQDIDTLLYARQDHPAWEEIATRCLACANCTMVCPTCFCSTMEDVTDLSGEHAGRWRLWDSCFTKDFSYIHGGTIRASGQSRYRQWMTHKLAGWIAQFGTSGCVGCGRCIAWCPVGIDITEEIRNIQAGTVRNEQGGEL